MQIYYVKNNPDLPENYFAFKLDSFNNLSFEPLYLQKFTQFYVFLFSQTALWNKIIHSIFEKVGHKISAKFQDSSILAEKAWSTVFINIVFLFIKTTWSKYFWNRIFDRELCSCGPKSCVSLGMAIPWKISFLEESGNRGMVI